MSDLMLEELSGIFPNKALLTVEEICESLSCDTQTIYNWCKRSNPKRRPPRIIIGNDVKFPKRPFLLWLTTEQGRGV
jgi:predicted DNA-binding transcriptional regulator AlpA